MIVRRVAPSPHLISRGLGLRELARHAAPITLSRALLQLQLVFDRAIASALVPGGVSALRYGDSIVKVPFGAISPAYQTAIYPTLVQTTLRPSESSLGATTQRLIRYGLGVSVPSAGLTIAVAPLATRLMYDRGSFSEADLVVTAQVVVMSAPLFVTWTVQPALVSSAERTTQGHDHARQWSNHRGHQRRARRRPRTSPGRARRCLGNSSCLGPRRQLHGMATVTLGANVFAAGDLSHLCHGDRGDSAQCDHLRDPDWAGVLDLAAVQQFLVLSVVGVVGLASIRPRSTPRPSRGRGDHRVWHEHHAAYREALMGSLRAATAR